MNFWIAYTIAFVAWYALYGFVSNIMNDLGICWVNAMKPQSETQYSLASTLTFIKRILFGVLMIVALVFLARHYPSYRSWVYGLGLLWSVYNGLMLGVVGLVVIVALWCAGV